jgi:hypothetical protein
MTGGTHRGNEMKSIKKLVRWSGTLLVAIAAASTIAWTPGLRI